MDYSCYKYLNCLHEPRVPASVAAPTADRVGKSKSQRAKLQ